MHTQAHRIDKTLAKNSILLPVYANNTGHNKSDQSTLCLLCFRKGQDFNPIALQNGQNSKFGRSECNRVKHVHGKHLERAKLM